MDVLRLHDVDETELARLLSRYELRLEHVDTGIPIPGSYWGDSEAGLAGSRLYARGDTPVHSVFHETGHFVCMTPERRKRLLRDAGGDDAEEDAVCYLQVLMSDELSCISRDRLFRDMDAWGYSFRLGSSERWFYHDADDASLWLRRQGLLNGEQELSWTKRGESTLPREGPAT